MAKKEAAQELVVDKLNQLQKPTANLDHQGMGLSRSRSALEADRPFRNPSLAQTKNHYANSTLNLRSELSRLQDLISPWSKLLMI